MVNTLAEARPAHCSETLRSSSVAALVDRSPRPGRGRFRCHLAACRRTTNNEAQVRAGDIDPFFHALRLRQRRLSSA